MNAASLLSLYPRTTLEAGSQLCTEIGIKVSTTTALDTRDLCLIYINCELIGIQLADPAQASSSDKNLG